MSFKVTPNVKHTPKHRNAHQNQPKHTLKIKQMSYTHLSLTHTHLDVSAKGVVIEELAQVVSIAGVFHLSIDENVPGEEPHFSSHVHPLHYLPHVGILGSP